MKLGPAWRYAKGEKIINSVWRWRDAFTLES